MSCNLGSCKHTIHLILLKNNSLRAVATFCLMEIFIIITISFIMFIRNATFKSSRQLIPFTEADTATNTVSSFGAYFALQSFASHIYIVTWLTCVSCKNQIKNSAQFTNNNINRAFLCVSGYMFLLIVGFLLLTAGL